MGRSDGIWPLQINKSGCWEGKGRVLCSYLLLNSHNTPSDQNYFLLASPAAGNTVALACQSFRQSSELGKHKSVDSSSAISALGSPWETVPESPAIIHHKVPEVGHLLHISSHPLPWRHPISVERSSLQPNPNQLSLTCRCQCVQFWLKKFFSCKWKTFWLKAVKLQQVAESPGFIQCHFVEGKKKAFKEIMSHGIGFPEGSLGFFSTKSFLTLLEQGLCETQQFWLSCYFSVPAFITLCLLGLTLPPLKWLSM